MPRVLVLALTALLAAPVSAYAQAGTAAKSLEPFKVGTFVIGNTQTVGIVLRDLLVVDLVQANAALQKARSWPQRTMPSEMARSEARRAGTACRAGREARRGEERADT